MAKLIWHGTVIDLKRARSPKLRSATGALPLKKFFFYKLPGLLGLGLGLGLEAKFSGLGLSLGLETSGLGLVFLALALFKAKVKVTNIQNAGFG